jgi:hypothetical protein
MNIASTTIARLSLTTPKPPRRRGFLRQRDDVCKENGIDPVRHFSGRFNARIDPELHAASISLNALLNTKDQCETSFCGGGESSASLPSPWPVRFAQRGDLTCCIEAWRGFHAQLLLEVEPDKGSATGEAFISAGGVDEARGVTCWNFHEVAIKQAAMESAVERHLVVDASKLGKVKAVRFSQLDQFDSLITEKGMEVRK